uniref:Uncharacterized protein n=1 Tax=Pithovirus LCPAC304 TaxID=2506594 RepID=A0A481Z747_9VIRU|nr:MAG: hypothetical protein LCPAC304_00040 [Pithovirus LCPAC304]
MESIENNKCKRYRLCHNRAVCECASCFTALCYIHREHTEVEKWKGERHAYHFCNLDCAYMFLGKGIPRAVYYKETRQKKEEAEFYNCVVPKTLHQEKRKLKERQ